ncbi:MAG: fimbrillin family protein [Bacteroidales bacterium]|nr:fimbrillin family protein [Bacteroidales bacterium]
MLGKSHFYLLYSSLLIAVAALLAGCSSGGDSPDVPSVVDPQEAMAFNVSAVDEEAARSSRADLQDVHTDFGVWAIKTVDGTNSYVMSHDDGSAYEAAWRSNAWTYDIQSDAYPQYLRYWDRAASDYLFVAYAPYRINNLNAAATYDISHTTAGVSIKGLKGNEDTSSVPLWAVALHKRNVSATSVGDYDLYKEDTDQLLTYVSDLTADVGLVFHPIMSKLRISIKNIGKAAVYVTDVVLSLADSEGSGALYTQADFEQSTFTFTDYTPQASLLSLTNLTQLLEGGCDPVTLAEFAEIPQELNGNQLTATITLSDGTVLTNTFPLSHDWEWAKVYDYCFSIDGGSLFSDYILFNVTVEMLTWTQGSPLEPDDVTNW